VQFFLGNSFSTKNKYPDQVICRDRSPKKRIKIFKTAEKGTKRKKTEINQNVNII